MIVRVMMHRTYEFTEALILASKAKEQSIEDAAVELARQLHTEQVKKNKAADVHANVQFVLDKNADIPF